MNEKIAHDLVLKELRQVSKKKFPAVHREFIRFSRFMSGRILQLTRARKTEMKKKDGYKTALQHMAGLGDGLQFTYNELKVDHRRLQLKHWRNELLLELKKETPDNCLMEIYQIRWEEVYRGDFAYPTDFEWKERVEDVVNTLENMV